MAIQHKIIFVTGGSTGIGLSIAQQLAAAGNQICIIARNEARLDAARASITAAGGKCNTYSADTKDYHTLKPVLDKAVAECGTPDILINCVGRAYPDHFENITAQTMIDTMGTNLGSVWNAIHILLPYMKKKGGKILNTSSIGGFVGVFGYADYSASKFAIIGLSEVLKQELAQYHISVQVLCPPDTETPGFETENKTKPQETIEISKTAKIMKPDAVAAKAIQALEGNTFLIVPNFDGKLTLWMKRHFPFIVNMVMDSAIAKVQKAKK
jgi:3-dehydrosphinganine reductase